MLIIAVKFRDTLLLGSDKMSKNKTSKAKPSLINLPNAMTLLRIAGSIVLLFAAPFTAVFYIIYTLTGITDILDGFTARMTCGETDFGAKLDSAADLIFYGCLLIKIFPKLLETLSPAIWAVLGGVILVRIVIYAMVFVRYKRFASIHSYLNKLTSIMVFFIAYAIITDYALAYCWAALTVAVLATAEELLIHATSKEYTSRRKSIFMKLPGEPAGKR